MTLKECNLPVVIDPGTYRWRLGISNSARPKTLFLTDTAALKDTVTIEDGLVKRIEETKKSLEYYEHYLKHGFHILNLNPVDSHICLAVPLKTATSYRRKLAEIVMEKMGANSVFLISQPMLAGYSSGYVTCVIVDSGNQFTSIFAMQDFNEVIDGQFLLPIGGQHIDRYFEQSIPCRYDLLGDTNRLFLKHHACYVSTSDPRYLTLEKKTVVLPDGNQISMAAPFVMAPELLFNPSLDGYRDVPSIPTSVMDAVGQKNNKKMSQLLNCVVVSGGNSKFPGITERIKSTIDKRTGYKKGINVRLHPYSDTAVWTGGSIITSLNTYNSIKITKADYREHGSNIVSNRWL